MDVPVRAEVAQRLQRLRAQLGLSQARLAAQLGVAFATVNRWERGQARPSAEHWQRIIRAEADGSGSPLPHAGSPDRGIDSAARSQSTSMGFPAALAGRTKLVGREPELALLRARLAAAIHGEGGTVLIAGEAGAGKTRLAEALAGVALQDGAEVLWGRSYEGEGASAFWPWLQLLRSMARARSDERLRRDLGSGAAALAELLPDLQERLSGLPELPPLPPDAARFRLFDAVITFLVNAAARRPLLLIFDDLQSADASSVSLLQMLAQGLTGAGLLILGCYRDEVVAPMGPLAGALAMVARLPGSGRIELGGLSEPDTARLIELICGQFPPPALTAAVYQQTDGNPFFVSETARLFARQRWQQGANTWMRSAVPVPRTVREVIQQRRARLSPACDEVLRAAAILGPEVNLALLKRLVRLWERGL